jgi:hypothetical protein
VKDAAREMKVSVTCWGGCGCFSGSIVSCSRVATWRGCCRAGGCTMVIVVLIDSVERLDEVVFASKTHVNKYPRKGSLVLLRTFGIEFYVGNFLLFFGDCVNSSWWCL